MCRVFSLSTKSSNTERSNVDLEAEEKPTLSKGSEADVTDIAANGRMPNEGEEKVNFGTKDSIESSISLRVTAHCRFQDC